MEFTASHRFDRPLDQVSAAFLDPDAHVGRYDLAGDREIGILRVEAGDDLLDLTTVRTVEGDVPAMAQRLVKATNTITTTERWERADGGPGVKAPSPTIDPAVLAEALDELARQEAAGNPLPPDA